MVFGSFAISRRSGEFERSEWVREKGDHKSLKETNESFKCWRASKEMTKNGFMRREFKARRAKGMETLGRGAGSKENSNQGHSYIKQPLNYTLFPFIEFYPKRFSL
ncbi:hypothetical protein EUTSA_v10022456mg [Eutrema salsugineum]|uniref:Uncharacterized protein n=1 Tax=Eutrema salsugineum TaxID=72664 RepID=V4L0R5_EUTSA|nr:hypothetical protein EUTSA_v10022456mg [Eutrema salsugineum]